MNNDLQHSYGEEFESKLKTFFSLDNGHVRKSGRSTLLAKILVETAIESEREIKVIDHFTGNSNNRHIRYNMLDIIQNRIFWFRDNDCPIGVRKLDHDNGIISLFVTSEFKELYERLRIKPWFINQNSIFPVNERKLNEQLLLIC